MKNAMKSFEDGFLKKGAVLMLAAALLLSGCGNPSGSSGSDTLYFGSTERAIYDPKAGF